MTGFAFRQNSFALGHALANFAYAGVLSEKLPSSRFSQVPAGSDCPFIEAVLSESKVKSLLHILFSLLYRKGKDKAIPAILPVAIDFPLVVSGDFFSDG